MGWMSYLTIFQSHYTATPITLQKALRHPNYGYEVGGVAVAVAVWVLVAVTVGEGDGVNVIVGGCALSLDILGAIHNA